MRHIRYVANYGSITYYQSTHAAIIIRLFSNHHYQSTLAAPAAGGYAGTRLYLSLQALL